MTGNGTADLLMGGASGSTGALWWEHDPALGFTQAHDLRLAPGFNVTDESMFVDLDGDGIVDLLVMDDRAPLGFFNDRGRAWVGPVVLPWGDAPAGLGRDQRFRLADMNGDGQFDLVLLRSRGVTYYPGLGGGRFGAAVEMEDTPDFALADPDRDVLLADVDGDGTTDLVLLGPTASPCTSPAAGLEPIELGRTSLNGDRAHRRHGRRGGLLWAMPQRAARAATCISTPRRTKALPLVAHHTHSTADIAHGRRALSARTRPDGRLTPADAAGGGADIDDAVTGEHLTTRYRYHDGHYDGMARQWLGWRRRMRRRRHWARSRAAPASVLHNQVGTATTRA
jgi:hypothetical protein